MLFPSWCHNQNYNHNHKLGKRIIYGTILFIPTQKPLVWVFTKRAELMPCTGSFKNKVASWEQTLSYWQMPLGKFLTYVGSDFAIQGRIAASTQPIISGESFSPQFHFRITTLSWRKEAKNRRNISPAKGASDIWQIILTMHIIYP